MRKLQKAALAAAMVGTLSLIATGTASADDHGHGHGHCKSHDLNVDVLGQVGLLNGLAGNLANGEGHPGAQFNNVGSSCHH
ncbi:hypothetical protein [Streptomyces sp. NBC_01092]|uniref:hypothetical protein n=1 Tax=Streptomyces sp. NBC_01092 TaxID=2903748 RepID=UPI0038632CCD|nr:hypothetical protein OG254_18845 [Streptomyces sp. NBC_01092]